MLIIFRDEGHKIFHTYQYFSRHNVVQMVLKLQNKGKSCNRFPEHKIENINYPALGLVDSICISRGKDQFLWGEL